MSMREDPMVLIVFVGKADFRKRKQANTASSLSAICRFKEGKGAGRLSNLLDRLCRRPMRENRKVVSQVDSTSIGVYETPEVNLEGDSYIINPCFVIDIEARF